MITHELLDLVARLTHDRVPFVIATVVRARRPTSVRPGDRAVIRSDGTIEGFVGGACAESSVRLYSLRALETGEPVLLRLIPDDAEELHDAWSAPGATDAADIAGAVVERNPCLSGGALEIFLEPQLPAARVVIVGSTPIARALERVAAAARYDVLATAGGPVELDTRDAAVIVASHGREEEQALRNALAAGVPYVALVASAKRGAAVRDALELADELRAQLRTPAGLDLGARTPEEIAISILAELVAQLHAQPRDAPAAPATAVDPVCGMEVAVTPDALGLEIAGERFFFCSSACREAYATERAAD